VPDTTPVLRLLDQFRQAGQHIAIVVDEYGSVEGIVSITDIIESITGGLPERGRETVARPVRREDGSWLIDGMTPIDEVEALTGLKDMQGEGDFETLAGFMIEKLGRIPAAGDHFHWEGARFEVVDMDSRRVDMVIVMPPEEEEARG
jgi:putative hemolysin